MAGYQCGGCDFNSCQANPNELRKYCLRYSSHSYGLMQDIGICKEVISAKSSRILIYVTICNNGLKKC